MLGGKTNWKNGATKAAVVAAAALTATAIGLIALARAAEEKNTPGAAKPALTVTTILPQRVELPGVFSASGNIVAWQEAIIGAEANGLRLNDIRVNVGDVVKQGQVLATFAPETMEAESAQARASVAEAEAALAEAQANAERARTLESSGALSAQQINQYLTAAKTAEARLASARAGARASAVRLAHTELIAPDSGTISGRVATVGAVVMGGQELFRMVRKNRLEWRGEVTATELSKVQVGQAVKVFTPAGVIVPGRVRVIAPTVDPLTRNVQVYVDLERNSAAKAGMFARGEFELGATPAVTVPQQSVVVRDGFSYVFVMKPDNRVTQQKVTVGRRMADRIEVTTGLAAGSTLVAQGAGFLNDGDLVKVVTEGARPAPPAGGMPGNAGAAKAGK